MRVDAARDEDPLAAGRPAGHQRRLGGRRGAVVVRCRDDVEVDQLGQQRFVLVDALQRALADLGLVRRVGRVPLAAEQQLVDGRRRPVAVDAGAEERREVGPVAGGQAGQPGGQLELGLRVGQVEAATRAAPAGMSSNSWSTEVRPSAPSIRARSSAVWGPYGIGSVSPRRSARRRRPRRAGRRPGPASASRTRIIQPAPYGSLLTSSGLGAPGPRWPRRPRR